MDSACGGCGDDVASGGVGEGGIDCFGDRGDAEGVGELGEGRGGCQEAQGEHRKHDGTIGGMHVGGWDVRTCGMWLQLVDLL